MNQNKAILNHLMKNKSITSLEAINLYGATRLSAIIYNLRKSGYDITSKTTAGINRFGNKTYFSKYILNNGGEDDNKNE